MSHSGPTGPSSRNPYPFPQPEGDLQFTRQDSGKNRLIPPCQEDQWNRLFNKKTMASSRREIFHHDSCAPNDYLDFELKSVYDHHNQFMRGRNEVMKQNDMRKLKNRPEKCGTVENNSSASDGLANKTLYVVKARTREDSNNHDGAIPSHHNAATNRGYSRKHDGGIFSI